MANPQSGPPIAESALEEAIALARSAGARTLEWYGSATLDVDHKHDGSPVTEADRTAERHIRRYLAEHHPADAVLGEEEGSAKGTSARTWFIDPIDGTRSFVRGVPLFATLLALEDEHGPAIGVIDLPALGETVAAGRGLGCHLNGASCTVSTTDETERAVLSTSSYDATSLEMMQRLHASGMQLVTWGDAYGYALVATGRVDAMLDPIVEAWDIAPMAVIVPEAGGRFTDFAGTPSFRSNQALATNGGLHDRVLATVNGS